MSSTGKRYSEEQIIRMLKELASGTSVAEVCRKYNVAETTVYRWKTNFGDMDQQQLRRLRELEAENQRLRKLVAQQSLDIDGLKDLASKNW